MNNVTELAHWGRDGLEGHVTRTIFILEAAFEPYDCANLNLTVTPSQPTHGPLCKAEVNGDGVGAG